MKKKNPEIGIENREAEEEKNLTDAEAQKKKALDSLPRLFQGKSAGKYTMNTEKTIEQIEDNYKRKGPEAEQFIHSRLASGKEPHVRLKGTAQDFYLTGNEASGQYLTEESPGDSAEERKENLQLPPSNDGKDVYRARLTEPHIVVESTVVPQKKFAAESGYQPREGMKQVFVPPKYGETKPIVSIREQVDGETPHVSEREKESPAKSNDHES